jgi:rhodanese-related sulfurtransferase
MPGPNQISLSQLSRLIGTPDAPAIVDVRLPDDVQSDPRLIPGAMTLRHDAADPAPAVLHGRRVVVVCHRGLKLSQEVAALLRLQGIAAEVLEGGAAAWAEAALPMVPVAALPPRPLWVTRHRPRIDRIACPWLIRRFVDPAARFLFVAPTEVLAVADRFGATAFDTPGARWTHQGDRCTFDMMLCDFALRTPALDRLAMVVRAADTNRHDLAPQAAGLLALSVGLSRMFRDDLAQLEAGMTMYDALYRWARDGADEGHDWQPQADAGGQA